MDGLRGCLWLDLAPVDLSRYRPLRRRDGTGFALFLAGVLIALVVVGPGWFPAASSTIWVGAFGVLAFAGAIRAVRGRLACLAQSRLPDTAFSGARLVLAVVLSALGAVALRQRRTQPEPRGAEAMRAAGGWIGWSRDRSTPPWRCSGPGSPWSSCSCCSAYQPS